MLLARVFSFKDVDAGKRGLLKCLGPMAAYDNCMVTATAKSPPAELYRVAHTATRRKFIILMINFTTGSRGV